MDLRVMCDYVAAHQGRFVEELKAFLRIPSVSAWPHHGVAVREAATFMTEALARAGAEGVRLLETEGYPLVYGAREVDPALPTLLVYGHYDVQPPGEEGAWESPPFVPTVRGGSLYARGASDDKGQAYLHVKALEAMVACQALPCNVKFLFEGEEEVGSPSLATFLDDPAHQVLLAADVVVVSDTAMPDTARPAVPVALRGVVAMELTVRGPARDLHAGVYGGAVANPIYVLCQLLAGMKDAVGRVTLPGFYQGVLPPAAEVRAALQVVPFDLQAYQDAIGIADVVGEAGYTTLERTGVRPCLEVNGIWGGYTGQGFKTVIPPTAHAKLSMRLVAGQTPAGVATALRRYLAIHAPKGATVQLEVLPGGSAALATDPAAVATQAALEAFATAWGHGATLTWEGGSIPILQAMQERLGVAVTFLGFGLEGDAIHGPDEHFSLAHFAKGITTTIAFYHAYARRHKRG